MGVIEQLIIAYWDIETYDDAKTLPNNSYGIKPHLNQYTSSKTIDGF